VVGDCRCGADGGFAAARDAGVDPGGIRIKAEADLAAARLDGGGEPVGEARLGARRNGS
jgi:hypothetical protein